MSEPLNEIEALKAIDEVFNKVTDTASKNRILKWLISKYGDENLIQMDDLAEGKSDTKKKKTNQKKKNPSHKVKVQVSLIKDLVLSPKGKQSFKEFINEKKPSSHFKKFIICVYYLIKVTELEKVSLNHIYTCYKNGLGKGPIDYKNMLHQTGTKGWLDTIDSENILITPMGEDIIEHELPKKVVKK